jgi:hypothetical protein
VNKKKQGEVIVFSKVYFKKNILQSINYFQNGIYTFGNNKLTKISESI